MELKYFQLEEMEDKESCETEIYLNADSTVSVGYTDGPLHKEASGTWDLTDDILTMTIKRTFDAGQEKTSGTDMGEFSFDVERVFSGDFKAVGELTAFQGAIHEIDDMDKEVGYFNMIDTTEERLGGDE